MKFVLLDVYPNENHRLIKDTAGGYGTGNNFGNSIFSKILNIFVDNMIGMPPMYLMYISSVLKQLKSNEIHYTRDVNDPNIEDADYIIASSSIIAHETELKAIKKLSHKKIFVAGVFANTFEEKYKEKNTLVIKNEPESFFFNLIKENKLTETYLNNLFNGIEKIPQNNFQINLDELPFPDWEYYVNKKYPLRNDFFDLKNKIAIPLLATRGCPYSCFNYCTYPLQQGRKVRARTPKNIVKEMKYWMEKLNTRKFVFRDPVFSINKKHTIELCEEIIKEKLNITYLIETHLNNLDDKMMKLLYKSGLKMVYVGIESSSAAVLKDINRFTIENDKQYNLIKNLEDYGIAVKSMFMFGNPDDNERTIKDTIKYARNLPNLFSQFSIFTPYPGTPIYEKYKNIITENKLENFNQYKLTYSHKNFTVKKIEKLKNFAYLRFYLDLKKIFKILKFFVISKYDLKT